LFSFDDGTNVKAYILFCDMICVSTAIGLTSGGSSTVHIYTQIIHGTAQIQTIHRTTQITTEQYK